MQVDFEKKMLLFMQGHIQEDIVRVLKEDPRYNHQPLVKEIVRDKEDLTAFQDKIITGYVYGTIDMKNSYWVNLDGIIDRELGRIKDERIARIESVYSGTDYMEALTASHQELIKKAVSEALEATGEYEHRPIAFKDAVDRVMYLRLCDIEKEYKINWKETLAGGDWSKEEIYERAESENDRTQ